MNTRILAGALGLVVWGGGVALAEDQSSDCVRSSGGASMSGAATGGSGASSYEELDELDVEEDADGKGGEVIESETIEESPGVGGAGQGECVPYGGAGMSQSEQAPSDVPQAEPPASTQPQVVPVPVPVPAPMTAVVVQKEPAEEQKPNLSGVSVLVGGGVEGYTGDLAPQINPGAAWGVGVGLRPTPLLGVELDYSGAANDLDSRVVAQEDLISGADIIRNGGDAMVTVGLTTTKVQPYLLAGVGFSYYNVRNAEGAPGYNDDTNGDIPVGAGVRGVMGNFTADARLGYSFLWDQEFAPVGTTDIGDAEFADGGRYSGMIRVGAQF